MTTSENKATTTGTGFVTHMEAGIWVATIIFWLRIRLSKMYDYWKLATNVNYQVFLIFVGCNELVNYKKTSELRSPE